MNNGLRFLRNVARSWYLAMNHAAKGCFTKQQARQANAWSPIRSRGPPRTDQLRTVARCKVYMTVVAVKLHFVLCLEEPLNLLALFLIDLFTSSS